MVGRCAHEGKAQRHVDGLGKREGLGRDQGLVVIHAKRHVIAGSCRPMEHAVGGERPERCDALAPQGLDGWPHDPLILVAEGAAFAGMRVERSDRNPWLADAEAVFEIGGDHASCLHDQPLVQRRRHLAKRQVDRDRHRP